MAYQLSGQTAGNPTITCTIPDDVAEQKRSACCKFERIKWKS